MPKHHTAGPWYIAGGTIGTPDTAIASTYYANDSQQANARLIAAAPDMLQALEDAELTLMLHAERNEDVQATLDTVRAAMAKAEKGFRA